MLKKSLSILITFLLMFKVVYAQKVDKDLVLYVPFSDSCNDFSSNTYAYEVFGTKLVGEKNKACMFDGNNDYISYPNVDKLNQLTSLTLSCWIAPFSKRPFDSWISKSNDYLSFSQWRFGLGKDKDSQVGYTIWKDKWYDYWKKPCTIPIGRWTHVLLTVDVENHTASLYKNAKQISSWKVENYGVYEGPVFIGHQRDDFSYFHGMIDEVKIFSKILTQREINKLYKNFAAADKAEIRREYYTEEIRNKLSVPKDLNDGIKTSSANNFLHDTSAILSLINDIGNGKYQDINSLLIAKNNVLLVEEYFNGVNEFTLHSIFSVTKSVVALSIGKAVENGNIKSIEDDVIKYLPGIDLNLIASGAEKITIENLLTMTSGLSYPNDQDNEDVDCIDAFNKYLYYSNPVDTIAKFVYQGSDPDLLSNIIYNSTNLPIDKFSEKFLFQPLQINNYYWSKNPCGHPMGSYGLRITSRDMIKIGLLTLNHGRFNGKQIISDEWIKNATQTHININNPSDGYGYLWWTHTFTCNDIEYSGFLARGALGQFIFVLPSLDLVIVWTSRNEPPFKIVPFELTESIILPQFTD